MKKDINRTGIIILVCLFILFYFITISLLDKRKITNTDISDAKEIEVVNNNINEENIIKGLYNNVRTMYDVVNNKFTVSQDDTITIGNIIYKRITNFDEVMKNVFTENGVNKYIDDLNNYFAYKDGEYYLAGNLVNYQTYYFRGDNTNIYVLDKSETAIKGIIYEKWTSNNRSTLATIEVVNTNGAWLIDKIDILSSD